MPLTPTTISVQSTAAGHAAQVGIIQGRQYGLHLGDAWAQENACTASKMFGNQALMPMAALMATVHPGAVDYIRQAPVLVLAVMAGQKRLNTKKRHFALTQWKSLMHNKPRLRDVMRMYTLPLPLRQIRPGALAPSHWPIILELAKLPNSTLAQAIPLKYQSQWIKALGCWGAAIRERANVLPREACTITHFAWCATHWCDDAEIRKGRAAPAGDMADFARSPTFNPRWTWQQASAAQERWHEQLARAKYGDEKVDASPFPDEFAIGGYDFVALRTPLDLWAEGHALHHCVGSYGDDLVKGMCRLISLRKDGKRVATAEFRMHMPSNYHPVIETADTLPKKDRGGWRLRQFKGLQNCEPPTVARDALKEYTRHIADSQKLDKR